MTAPVDLSGFFTWLVRTSLQASVLALLILGVQALVRERLAPRWRHAMWLLVVARLLLPWAPASRWSVFNLAPALAPAAAPAQVEQTVFIEEGVGTDAPDPAGESAPGAFVAAPAASDDGEANLQTGAAAQPEGEPPPVSLAQRVVAGLAWGWLAGAAALAGAVLAQTMRLARLIRRQRAVTDQRTLELLEECKAALRMRAWLVVVESPAARSPALFGFLRPRLLLPEGATGTLTANQLRHVFLHELAHLKRGDIALNWVLAFLQALHWFNPVVWLAFRRMRGERELACDEMAMSCLKPGEASEYGRTIVRLLEQFSLARRLPGLACILEEKNQIKRRITMIAKFRKHSLAWSVAAALLMIILGGAGLTGAAQPSAAQAQRAKARLEAAEEKLGEVKARVEAGRSTTEDLDNAQGELKIAQAEAAGDAQGALKARLEKAQATLKHKKALFEAGILPELELRRAEAGVKIAQANLKGDAAAAAQAQLELASAVQKSTKARLEAGLAGQAELDRAQAAVEKAQRACEKAGVAIKTKTQPAPQTGTATYTRTIIGAPSVVRVITTTSSTQPRRVIISKGSDGHVQSYGAPNPPVHQGGGGIIIRTVTPDGKVIETVPRGPSHENDHGGIPGTPGPSQSKSFRFQRAPIIAGKVPPTALLYALDAQQKALDELKAQRAQTDRKIDESIAQMQRALDELKRGESGMQSTERKPGADPFVLHLEKKESLDEVRKRAEEAMKNAKGQLELKTSERFNSSGEKGHAAYPMTFQSGELKLNVTAIDVRPYAEGGLFEATIGLKNGGDKPLQKFDIKFSRDETERKNDSMNNAGPIEPGASWFESSMPFALKEGQNRITIEIDPNKKAAGLEKLTIIAEIQVTIKDGKIVSKGTSIKGTSAHSVTKSEFKFNSGGGGGSFGFGSASGSTSGSGGGGVIIHEERR